MFLGLTLVLIVALVTLIIKGRRLEKQQAGRAVEVVQKSKPSPTRAFSPRDLEIVHSKMQLEEKAGEKNQTHAARHEIEIRNNGSVPYGEIQFRFVYLDRSGKVLATKTRSVDQSVLPGATLNMTDIVAEDLPNSAADCRVSIDYADLGPASAQTK
jgi:hypothetical protein